MSYIILPLILDKLIYLFFIQNNNIVNIIILIINIINNIKKIKKN